MIPGSSIHIPFRGLVLYLRHESLPTARRPCAGCPSDAAKEADAQARQAYAVAAEAAKMAAEVRTGAWFW